MIAVSQQLSFRPITPEDAETAVSILEASSAQGCDTCFGTMYLWRHHYHNHMAVSPEGWLFFRFGDRPPYTYLHPEGEQIERKMAYLLDEAHRLGQPLILYGGDESAVATLHRLFPDRFTVSADEADADYIYRRDDLVNLVGNKYDGKRNHIARFTRRYAWTYEELCNENTQEFLSVARRWMEQRGSSPSLLAEYEGLTDLLAHREAFHVRGGLIRVDGAAVAVTCGVPVSHDTFDIQIEKALPEYSGAYPVINQAFASRLPDRFVWINRENDLGIEGLRQAKQSYHPAKMLKKHLCKERM